MTAKCVVVTGASGAIGSVVCRLFGQAGWKVMPLSIRPGATVALWPTPMDALICAHAAPMDAEPDHLLEVDVILTRHICRISYYAFVDYGLTDRGRIVLFSSIRAAQPRAGQTGYSAAKAAIQGMTRSMAVEYGPRGVTVNCIAPGAVESPRTEANIAAGVVSREELIARTPTGRLTTPEDVANLALFLCSPQAAQITGQVITVDGGWSVQG